MSDGHLLGATLASHLGPTSVMAEILEMILIGQCLGGIRVKFEAKTCDTPEKCEFILLPSIFLKKVCSNLKTIIDQDQDSLKSIKTMNDQPSKNCSTRRGYQNLI